MIAEVQIVVLQFGNQSHVYFYGVACNYFALQNVCILRVDCQSVLFRITDLAVFCLHGWLVVWFMCSWCCQQWPGLL